MLTLFLISNNLNRGAAIFTTSKNCCVLEKSVKKWVCFCQFQFEVYNWQYFILHWQNYTYYTVIITVHCHFHTYEIQYDCQIHSFVTKIHLVFQQQQKYGKIIFFISNYPLFLFYRALLTLTQHYLK